MNCCLCGSDPAPFSEIRPTGRDNAPQRWHYCPECWGEIQRQLIDTEPEVCTRYLIFLNYLGGHYAQRIRRYQRQLAGGRPPENDDPAAASAASERTDIPQCEDTPPGEIVAPGASGGGGAGENNG